jgi:hypothetical protein
MRLVDLPDRHDPHLLAAGRDDVRLLGNALRPAAAGECRQRGQQTHT